MGLLFGKSGGGSEHGSSGGAHRRQDMPVDQTSIATQLDKAKLELRRAKVRLSKHLKRLEEEDRLLTERARQFLKVGNKRRATMCIRLRKIKKKALTNLDAQLLNLEGMLTEIETDEAAMEAVKGMKAGTAALRQISKLMPVELVERVMDDAREEADVQSEISDLLQGTGIDDIDEDELNNELQEMEKKAAEEAFDLPVAPSGSLEGEKQDIVKPESEGEEEEEEEEEEEDKEKRKEKNKKRKKKSERKLVAAA